MTTDAPSAPRHRHRHHDAGRGGASGRHARRPAPAARGRGAGGPGSWEADRSGLLASRRRRPVATPRRWPSGRPRAQPGARPGARPRLRRPGRPRLARPPCGAEDEAPNDGRAVHAGLAASIWPPMRRRRAARARVSTACPRPGHRRARPEVAAMVTRALTSRDRGARVRPCPWQELFVTSPSATVAFSKVSWTCCGRRGRSGRRRLQDRPIRAGRRPHPGPHRLQVAAYALALESVHRSDP